MAALDQGREAGAALWQTGGGSRRWRPARHCGGQGVEPTAGEGRHCTCTAQAGSQGGRRRRRIPEWRTHGEEGAPSPARRRGRASTADRCPVGSSQAPSTAGSGRRALEHRAPAGSTSERRALWPQQHYT